MVSETTIPKLIELGILVVKPIPTEKVVYKKKPSRPNIGEMIHSRMNEVNMNIEHYVKILISKLEAQGLSKTNAMKSLQAIYNTNKSAYFALVLKEVAIELDKSYSNHISKSKMLFTISAATGKPYYIEPNFLKSTNTVALFRSEVDAIVACKILSSLKKEVFNGRK